MVANGRAEPYCVCEVPGKPQSKVKSKVINNDANLVDREVKDFAVGDKLQFSLWDEDTWPNSDDFLGCAVLESHDFYPCGFQGEVPLNSAEEDARLALVVTISHGTAATSLRASREDALHPPELPAHSLAVAPAACPAPAIAVAPPEDATAHAEALAPRPPVRLRVNVQRAHGLCTADGFHARTTDAYCLCEVPGRQQSKFKTQVVKRAVSPEWNAEWELKSFIGGDRLQFSVWGQDTWSTPDEFLGDTVLESNDFLPHGFHGDLTLHNSGLSKATLSVLVDVVDGADASCVTHHACGCQQYGSSHSLAQPLPHPAGASTVPARRVQVSILRAQGLQGDLGIMEAYCICEVPSKPQSKFKTLAARTPEWQGEWEVRDFEVGDPLRFSVWGQDGRPTADEFLGAVLLQSGSFVPHGFQGELQLEGTRTAARAFVTVVIDVLDASRSAGTECQPQRRAVDRALTPTPAPPPGAGKRYSLDVTIVGAKGLYNADGSFTGKSDAFCICKVVGNRQLKQSFRTKTVNNCLDPVWDALHRFPGATTGDVLEFEVYDADTLSKTLLGKNSLQLSGLLPSGGLFELPLTWSGDTHTSQHAGVLTVRVVVVASTGAPSSAHGQPLAAGVPAPPHALPPGNAARPPNVSQAAANTTHAAAANSASGRSSAVGSDASYAGAEAAGSHAHAPFEAGGGPGHPCPCHGAAGGGGPTAGHPGAGKHSTSSTASAASSGLVAGTQRSDLEERLETAQAMVLRLQEELAEKKQESQRRAELEAQQAEISRDFAVLKDVVAQLMWHIGEVNGRARSLNEERDMAVAELQALRREHRKWMRDIAQFAAQSQTYGIQFDRHFPGRWLGPEQPGVLPHRSSRARSSSGPRTRRRASSPSPNVALGRGGERGSGAAATAGGLANASQLPRVLAECSRLRERLDAEEQAALAGLAGEQSLAQIRRQTDAIQRDLRAALVDHLGEEPGQSQAQPPRTGAGGQVPLAMVWVTVDRARGLHSAAKGAARKAPSPYCVCEIPGKPMSKFATNAVRNSWDPEWGHQAHVVSYDVGDSLDFTVWDMAPESTQVLGCACLPSKDFFPNGFEGDLPLAVGGTPSDASITVFIEVLGPTGDPLLSHGHVRVTPSNTAGFVTSSS